MHTQQKGFTLIELMIVVVIVAILAAIAYPAYTDQVRKGRRAECRSGLLQSMQQQERFYSQYNTYVTFTSGQTDAKTKSFSGDNPENSACKIAATTCASGAINQCVELQASMVNSSDPVQMLYLTSGGDKGCTFKSSTRVTNEKQCWP